METKELSPDWQEIVLTEAVRLLKENPNLELTQAIDIAAIKHGFKLSYGNLCKMMGYED